MTNEYENSLYLIRKDSTNEIYFYLFKGSTFLFSFKLAQKQLKLLLLFNIVFIIVTTKSSSIRETSIETPETMN